MSLRLLYLIFYQLVNLLLLLLLARASASKDVERPSLGRRGFGGCSWPVCWTRLSTPRDATVSAARTPPEWEM